MLPVVVQLLIGLVLGLRALVQQRLAPDLFLLISGVVSHPLFFCLVIFNYLLAA